MEDDHLQDLYDHLAATGERPVERTASRWLGEAEAIAGDVADGDLPPEVQRERLENVEHLLANVEGTGDEAADEHVAAAEAILDEVLNEDS